MGQRLIVLPVTIAFRAARVGLRIARLPLDILGGLTGRNDDGAPGFDAPTADPPDGDDVRPAAAPRRAPPTRVPEPNGAGASAPPAPAPGVPPLADALDGGAVTAEEAAHVSVEPDLVGEFADTGAEEGAHAEVDVAEPWEGYSGMRARDIERRLQAATAEEVAVVRLYETMHKGRQSVLRATERRITQQAAERRRPR